jgi:hypothetical protein
MIGLGLRLGASGAARWNPLSESTVRSLYDTATGVTLNGSDVSAWTDQGPLAKNLAQATGANQWLYVTSGGPFGGLPHMSLTKANNDRMTAGAVSDYKFLHDGTGGWVAMRFRSTNAAALQVLVDTNALSGSVGMNLYYDGTNQRLLSNIGNGVVISALGTANGSVPINTAATVLWTYSETASPKVAIYTSAASPSTSGATGGAPSSANSARALWIGDYSAGGFALGGEIGRVMLGTGSPDAALRAKIFSYLARTS